MIMDLLDQSTPRPLSAPVHCQAMTASDDAIPSAPGQPARTAMDDEGALGLGAHQPVRDAEGLGELEEDRIAGIIVGPPGARIPGSLFNN